MKKYILFFSILALFSCQNDCLESSGEIIEQEIETPAFDKIIVGYGVQLFIKESNTQQVIIKAGKNRLEHIHITNDNGILHLGADPICMLSNSFTPAKAYISSPTISSIRNASEYCVESVGVLHYPELTLLVEDDESNYLNVGDFKLQVANEKIHVVSNGIANCYLSGTTEQLILGYYNGIGRFEGKELIARKVDVLHRAENTLKVYPVERLTGDIYSIGNLVSYHHPSVVDIREHYEGKLIIY